MEHLVIVMTYYPGPTTAEKEPAARANRRRRFRSGAADRHTSLLFWLTVLGLGCVSLLTATWGASCVLAQKGSEKLLHVERLFPKLKSVHGEHQAGAVRMSEPDPGELADPKERKTPAPLLPAVIDLPKAAPAQTPLSADGPEPPRLAASEPGLNLIPQAQLTLPPAETCDDPVIYIHQCTPQRGDTPMIRNWKTLTMYSLLSAAAVTFAPQPAVVFAHENEPAKADATTIEGLSKRITALENKKLSEADKDAIAGILRQELKKLEEGALANLQKSVDTLEGKMSALQLEQLKHKLEQQKFLIDHLTKRLDGASASPVVDKAMLDTLKAIQEGIAKLAPAEKRSSAYPPNGTATNTGRVMLVNQYSDELLFIVNGVGHRLPAYASKLLEPVPVGTVTIEVFSQRFGGVFYRQPTTLAGGETFTLTANPPR